jgi:hypothetical protein
MVEAAVGIPVEHIACSRTVVGMGINLDGDSRVGAAELGYLALTDNALLFVRRKRGAFSGRQRHDVLLRAPFDEITGIVTPSLYNGMNLEISLAVNKEFSLVQVAKDRNGEAILEALRARVVEVCGDHAVLTERGVTCP